MSKVHNAPDAHVAKLDLRRRVLAELPDARVFDAFAGRGEMFRGAWRDASAYTGCDLTWEPSDPGRRWACDNLLAMTAESLDAFNVFDFDAFGSPWRQMLLLARMRSWRGGEAGAVVLTDGSHLRSRFGLLCHAQAELAGVAPRGLPPKGSTGVAVQRMALRGWMARCNVTPLHSWQAKGRGSGKGGAQMVYTAVVFAGNKGSR